MIYLSFPFAAFKNFGMFFNHLKPVEINARNPMPQA